MRLGPAPHGVASRLARVWVAGLAIGASPVSAQHPQGQGRLATLSAEPDTQVFLATAIGVHLVARLAGRLRAIAEPDCVAERKLDDRAFGALAHTIMDRMGRLLRDTRVAAANLPVAEAEFATRMGPNIAAEVDRLRADANAARVIALEAEKFGIERGLYVLELIDRAFIVQRVSTGGRLSLEATGGAVRTGIEQVGAAMDDFVSAHGTPNVVRILELISTARSIRERSLDRARLNALKISDLIDAVAAPLRRHCIPFR